MPVDCKHFFASCGFAFFNDRAEHFQTCSFQFARRMSQMSLHFQLRWQTRRPVSKSHQLRYTPPSPWAIYDGSRSALQCAPCQPDFFGLVILVLVCPSPMVTSTESRRRASKVSRLHDRHGKDWFFALTVDAKSFHFAEVFSLLAPNASVGSTVHPRFHWFTTLLFRATRSVTFTSAKRS